MPQYNSFNVKLPNSQLNKLNSGIKNGNKVTLKLLSNVIGDPNDEINFPHKVRHHNVNWISTDKWRLKCFENILKISHFIYL